MTPRKVAIIGGGSSGITAVKACIEEGLDVVCFERTSEIGGLWRYTESNDEDRGSVMKSTIINTSKELSAFSDFPPPADFPNYMHNSKMIKYLDMYADEYAVRKHIKVRHDVVSASPLSDGSNRWKVRVKNLEIGEESEDTYDGILVCTGHHCYPLIPKFAGQEKFKGRILHTHEYKKPTGFEDHQVCVVGIGNSGGDAAVELSSVADQVYLCARRGTWVSNRVGENGIPSDLQGLTRWNSFLFHLLPMSLSCWIAERRVDRHFDHELYNMKPAHRFFSQHPMLNDGLPHRILSGTVKVKGSIKQFTERGIIFEGDSEETPIDDVILATGYDIKFPFFKEEIVACRDNDIRLYKLVFDPKHPTLAFIGMVQPLGPLMPVAEMQCRWVAHIFSGKQKLPSEKQMNADIESYKKANRARFFESPRNTLEADWIPYMNNLAETINVKPNLLKLFFTDAELWTKLVFGPSLPYQYRLNGPGKWSDARKTILQADERICATLQTKKRSVSWPGSSSCCIVRSLRIIFLLLIPLLVAFLALQSLEFMKI